MNGLLLKANSNASSLTYALKINYLWLNYKILFLLLFLLFNVLAFFVIENISIYFCEMYMCIYIYINKHTLLKANKKYYNITIYRYI